MSKIFGWTRSVSLLGLCAGLMSCSAEDVSRGRYAGVVGDSGQGGSGAYPAGSGGKAGFGAAGNPNGGSSPIVPIGSPGDEVCGASSQAATRVVTQTTVEVPVEVVETAPVAIYIVLDRSASMSSYEWTGGGAWGAGGGSLWDLAVASVSGLVNDPASAGVDVALEYFPSDGFGLSQCDGNEQSVPSVDIGRLPGHAVNIVSSLNFTMPNGSDTPIEAALRGGSLYCQGFKSRTPGEDCVVLLVTDGEPSACNENFAALAGIAGDAFTAHGIRTFTVGIGGASFDLLDLVAIAGGTDCDPGSAHNACDATGGELQAALTTIRDTVVTTSTRTEIVEEVVEMPLDCEWNLPPANPGEVFSSDLVNVRFTSAPGAAATDFGRVNAVGECGDLAIAWHYDNAANPARILACDETCNAIKAAPEGQIDILLGCPAIVLQ